MSFFHFLQDALPKKTIVLPLMYEKQQKLNKTKIIQGFCWHPWFFSGLLDKLICMMFDSSVTENVCFNDEVIGTIL